MSSKLTVKQLRGLLSKRGLDTDGLKPALVSRLDEAIAEDGATADSDVAASDGKNGNAKTADSDDGIAADDTNDKKGNAKKKKTHPRDDDDDDDVAADGDAKRVKVEEVEKMTVEELKKALVAAGCSGSGAKAVLKKRLISALENEGKSDDDGEPEKKMVTATKKGRAVLDSNLPDDVKAGFHVLELGDDIYDAMLNQTNVGGNNNKFYVLQALENDTGTSWMLYTRWGRVGAKGQSNLLSCNSRNHAVGNFVSTFSDKTKNSWEDRHTFTSVPGKYTWLEMDYDDPTNKDDKKEVAESTKSIPKAPSKLNPALLDLISTICNVNMMKQQMMEIGYDARKMPLGKLSKSTILKGYGVLKRIAAALESSSNHSALADLSSEFYTVIPHDFGFRKMKDFIIETPQLLKTKLEMVEALGEIELASKLLESPAEDADADPAFDHYQKLKCDIEPLLMDTEEAMWIKEFTDNTHGPTHGSYKINVEQIFKVVRNNEENRFKPFTGEKNRMLLWHGSRLCNWTGILSQGLRIAPPEAPVSGYMFGKGVYFADMVTKSANYCYPNHQDPVGLLLLCEVALGDMRELVDSDYSADQLPPGKLSTKGLGRTAPDSKKDKVLPDGVVVPMGKPVKQGKVKKAVLEYNEYIVYDTSQIRMRYLLKVRFKYGR